MMTQPSFLISSVTALTLAGGLIGIAFGAVATNPDEAQLKTMAGRFAPVDLAVDLSALPDNEKAALAKLVQAARIMDSLFMRQVWSGNETLQLRLLEDSSPLGKARLEAFMLNKGPWSRLDHDAAFIPGVPEKPKGGHFYPAGATKQDVEAWIASVPEAERPQATGFYTTVRRAPDGKFIAVPYSVEYQGELEVAAALLKEAAALTTQPTLKVFLEKRAAAFLTNDYYDSDVAWMELDSSVEPTIGPYEVYEDEWFNYKAAFEAFITVRDDAETAKLAKFGGLLQDIENNLPIAPKLRNPKLGSMAPIRVVNQVIASGDGNRGVKTAAFNLPNDERITKEKGAKRVMLKNVQEAKFNNVLMPISKIVLSEADQKNVAFDVFFTHILMHELMHGLGPHNIKVAGKESTVRQELKDTYSAIEEAKADISGLFALQYLINKGQLPKEMEKTMYTTFLASSFRTIRFGINEAHGKGQAIQLNYLLDAGAVQVAKDGRFSVNPAKAKDAVKKLTGEIMTLQAEGNIKKAQELIAKLGNIRPPVQKMLDQLKDVPVDIEPRFVTAQQLMAQ